MDEGNELGLDVNIGFHPYDNMETNTGIFFDVGHNSKT